MSTRDEHALSSSVHRPEPRSFFVGQLVLAPIIPKVGFRKATSWSKRCRQRKQNDETAGPMFVSLPLSNDRIAPARLETNAHHAVRSPHVGGGHPHRVAYLEGDIQFGRATVSGLACYGNIVVRFDDSDVDVQVPCGMVHPWIEFSAASDPQRTPRGDARTTGDVVKRELETECSSSARLHNNVSSNAGDGGRRGSPFLQRRRLETFAHDTNLPCENSGSASAATDDLRESTRHHAPAPPTLSSRQQGPTPVQPPTHVTATALVAYLAESISINQDTNTPPKSSTHPSTSLAPYPTSEATAAAATNLCLFENPRLLSLCCAAWQHLPGFRSGSLRLFRLVDDNCCDVDTVPQRSHLHDEVIIAPPSCGTFFALQSDVEDALLESNVPRGGDSVPAKGTAAESTNRRSGSQFLPAFVELPFLGPSAASFGSMPNSVSSPRKANPCRLHQLSRVTVIHDCQTPTSPCPSTGTPSSSEEVREGEIGAAAVERLLTALNRVLCREAPLSVEHIVLGHSHKTTVFPYVARGSRSERQTNVDGKPAAEFPKVEAPENEERFLLPSRLSSLQSLYEWLSSLEGDVSRAPEPLDSDAFQREWQKRSWHDLLGFSCPSRQLKYSISAAVTSGRNTVDEKICATSPLYEFLRAATADAWASLPRGFPRTLILVSLPGFDEATLPWPWRQIVELVECGSQCRIATPLLDLRFAEDPKQPLESTWDEAVLERWRRHGGLLMMPVPTFPKKDTTTMGDRRCHLRSGSTPEDDAGSVGNKANRSLLLHGFRCCYAADNVVLLGGEALRWYRSNVPSFFWGERREGKGRPASLLVTNEMEMALRGAVSVGLPRCLATVKHLSWMLWEETGPADPEEDGCPPVVSRTSTAQRHVDKETATSRLKRKLRQLYLTRYPVEEILSTAF